MPVLVVIVGPTASGKTELALRFAKRFNTEIVSADSRQFYKEMEIGTAKPSAQELKQVPHHFVNNLSIQDEYNVGKYEKEALTCLDGIFKTHKVAILVGGAGLFVNAVCQGLDSLPEGDSEVREFYEKVLKEKGIETLQNELREKDPVYFETVDKKNPRRLIRALEVCKVSGLPYSQFRNKRVAKRDFDIIKIGIAPDKEEVVKRIDSRTDAMIVRDWLEECKALYPLRNLNALKTVGYNELFDFIEDKYSWEETIEKIKTNTWHYAKRQLTWFRKDKEIKWFTSAKDAGIDSYITTFVPS